MGIDVKIEGATVKVVITALTILAGFTALGATADIVFGLGILSRAEELRFLAGSLIVLASGATTLFVLRERPPPPRRKHNVPHVPKGGDEKWS